MYAIVRRVALGVPIGLVVIVAVIAVIAELRWDRTYDTPLPSLRASTDSASIARGRYLATGPAHCAECHSAPGVFTPADTSIIPSFVGGREFALPGGIVRAPNITNDSATGIGRFSDSQIARTLRYGVLHDGQVMLPFMEFKTLADSDVVAVLSYLRSAPPVRNAVAQHDYSLVTKAIMAFLVKPELATVVPALVAPRNVGAERGEYLVSSVANCAGCHTNRDMGGKAIGPRLAGGLEMDSEVDASTKFVTPNLTPDTHTGHIATWSAEQFVARIRAGRVIKGSPMPWEAFSRMSEDDLRSIYSYLRSIPAVANNTGETMRTTQVALSKQ